MERKNADAHTMAAATAAAVAPAAVVPPLAGRFAYEVAVETPGAGDPQSWAFVFRMQSLCGGLDVAFKVPRPGEHYTSKHWRMVADGRAGVMVIMGDSCGGCRISQNCSSFEFITDEMIDEGSGPVLRIEKTIPLVAFASALHEAVYLAVGMGLLRDDQTE